MNDESVPSRPKCPLCSGTQFERQEGKIDSKWGFKAHRVVLLICQRCRFVMPFYKGSSIFVVD
jgi:hypothetical protein